MEELKNGMPVYCLNGSLAGLVAITAPCAYIAPWAAVLIGLTGGILVVFGVDLIEALHIDDPVGAFAVHGINGMMGTLSIGLFGLASLTNKPNRETAGLSGLFMGGGLRLLVIQLVGVAAVPYILCFGALGLFIDSRRHRRPT